MRSAQGRRARARADWVRVQPSASTRRGAGPKQSAFGARAWRRSRGTRTSAAAVLSSGRRTTRRAWKVRVSAPRIGARCVSASVLPMLTRVSHLLGLRRLRLALGLYRTLDFPPAASRVRLQSVLEETYNDCMHCMSAYQKVFSCLSANLACYGQRQVPCASMRPQHLLGHR
jgi:hypothetical protein